MNVFGTGLSGLVGSRIVQLLAPRFRFENASLETGTDITDAHAIAKVLRASPAPWVFHFAAYTDVQKAETTRAQGAGSLPWQVNVEATKHIASICQQIHKHLLYLSTDYVFDGTKEEYSEEDTPNPQGWYAITKYEGEKYVRALGPLGLIVRIANPYRASPVGKTDFVHKIRDRLRDGNRVEAADDQLFVPTFIDDIAMAIATLVDKNASDIYHVVGADAVSPFAAAQTVARVFGLNEALVVKITFAQFIARRAPTPQRAVLAHDKINKLGVRTKTFRQGLEEVRRQEERLVPET